MALLSAFALMFAAASGGGQVPPAHNPTKAIAPAQASVRILPGARVSFRANAEASGHVLKDATIIVEDGTRRPAKLVEFQ